MITLLLAIALLTPAPALDLRAAADKRGASLWWTAPAAQHTVLIQRVNAPVMPDALLAVVHTSEGHAEIAWGPDIDGQLYGGSLRVVVIDAEGRVIAADTTAPTMRVTLWAPWAA